MSAEIRTTELTTAAAQPPVREIAQFLVERKSRVDALLRAADDVASSRSALLPSRAVATIKQTRAVLAAFDKDVAEYLADAYPDVESEDDGRDAPLFRYTLSDADRKRFAPYLDDAATVSVSVDSDDEDNPVARVWYD